MSKALDQFIMKLLIYKKAEKDGSEFTITGNGPYQLNKDGIKLCSVSEYVTSAVSQIRKALGVQVKDSVTPIEYTLTTAKSPKNGFYELALPKEVADFLTKRFSSSCQGQTLFVVTSTETPDLDEVMSLIGHPVSWVESTTFETKWFSVGEYK